MALTARQRKFVDAYLVSGNATSAAVAAGYSEKTAYSIGSENLSKPEIAAAVQARQQRAAAKADLTLESHLASLNALKEQAAAANQFGPAVTAEVSRGRASGFYVEKTEHTGKDGKPIEVRVRIAREGRRVTAS
jgi:phage terminase small subunit